MSVPAELYERAFRASPDAVTVSRLEDGIIVDANAAFYELTGFDREDVIGTTAIELSLYEDASDRSQMVRRVLHRGSVSGHEVAVRTKHGALRRASISAHIVGIGGTVHLFAAARDITRSVQAREEMILEVMRLRSATHTPATPRLVELSEPS